ncbi:oxidoreductase [Methylobacterium tarhaniae]|uniref:Oxidoreductase n=1 Tax=Methylobacterium tarhaniae TaxID=1187852 RepID=A0A0J6SXN0_9HYPH|nr:Gfo/Idh/MocA family oxidoreductase [Methylobacterium tarhaniae]KMO38078.1 oxidoreductase [Methylobacterium tarhaniae]
MIEPRRLLIVGAKFGEIYLNAFMQGQAAGAHGAWELAGLLANGSPRSRALAHAFGIPLFTALDELPSGIDAACVVVRSTSVGGAGTWLAEGLLERGIHVVQEHPVHPDEIARLQSTAGGRGLVYWVNSFYPWCPAGRVWVDRARRVRDLCQGALPTFAEIATSRQLLYSSLDLLLQATGCDPDRVAPRRLAAGMRAFDAIELPLEGSTALLRLQTYMDPSDPDLSSLVMHRMSLGWDAGYLSLEASHGPVTWTPALHLEGHRSDTRSLYGRAALPEEGRALALPTSVVLRGAAPDWATAFEVESPAGIGLILDRLAAHLDGESPGRGLELDYQLALSRLWQRTQRCAGPPQERRLPAPAAVDPRDLLADDPRPFP